MTMVIKMKEILKDPVLQKQIITEMKRGAVFVYPTDTIYGIGCNANKSDSVSRIRKAKGSIAPFSVIAPTKDWVEKNFKVKHPAYIDRLPGPYTMVMKKKRQVFLFWVGTRASIGVRIPDHPFQKLVKKSGVPFVSTSVNKSGHRYIRDTSEIPEEMKLFIDFIIDDGKLDNKPSRIFDLTGDRPVELRRPSERPK
jgi:tRNA threonylcarbamoyl adenosine modification protein (Sua5/YciO/YrdC/YwlC family)